MILSLIVWERRRWWVIGKYDCICNVISMLVEKFKCKSGQLLSLQPHIPLNQISRVKSISILCEHKRK